MDQVDIQAVAIYGLLGAAVAFGCGMALFELLGGTVKGSRPVETGRRWMNWVVLASTTGMLSKFFSLLFSGYGRPGNAFAAWIAGTVVLGALAFAIGAVIARLRSVLQASGIAATLPTPFIATSTLTPSPPSSTVAPVMTSPAAPIASTQSASRSSTGSVAPQESTMMDEDAIYDAIAKELDTGATDKGLWTRLFAECDGDENKTKVAYIKQRAERIRTLEQGRIAAIEKQREEAAAEIKKQRDETAAKFEQLRQQIAVARRKRLATIDVTDQQMENIASLGSTHTAAMFRDYVCTNDMAKTQELLKEMPLLTLHWEEAYGDTPLHLAVKHRLVQMTRLLIEHGAQIGQTNMDGDTPMDIAKKTGNREIVELLSAAE